MAKRIYVKIAEEVLGKELPRGSVVHHVDEDRSNNRKDNLVILQSQAEHQALHRRLRIKQAGGNPWTQQICCTCQLVLDVDQFPKQTNPRYNMEYRGECKACIRNRNKRLHNIKNGRDPNWKESQEEKSSRGRLAAIKRWAG